MNKNLKKVLSCFLALLLLLPSFGLFGGILSPFEEKAQAYSNYSKQYNREYYYSSGTRFIARAGFFYKNSGSSNEAAVSAIEGYGYTHVGRNFNAGDGKKSAYVHMGVSWTTNPADALTAFSIWNGGSRPTTHTKTMNGSSITFYRIGDAGNGVTTDNVMDGVVDLSKDGGGDDLTMYATKNPNAGGAITSFDMSQSSNGDTARNTLTNNGYTIVTNQDGNYQDCNAGQGGDYVYCGYKSSLSQVDSSYLRTAYANAKWRYENGESGVSGLASALNTASNILSDLNDGYTTYNQTSINNATRALEDAVPTISLNSAVTVNINVAGMQRYYKFTPSESGDYIFFSYGSVDPYGYIYSRNTSGSRAVGSQLTYQDDGGAAANAVGASNNQFYIKYSLSANTTYFLSARLYNSSNTGSFPIKVCKSVTATFNPTNGQAAETRYLPAGHTFKPANIGSFSFANHSLLAWSSTATGAMTKAFMNSDTPTVPSSNTNYYALWNPSSPIVISPNNSYSAPINYASQIVYYTFTPSQTRTYVIYGTSTADTYGIQYVPATYASSATYAATSDDDGTSDLGQQGNQFRFEKELTAGTTYMFGVKYYNANVGSVPFKLEDVYKVTFNANGGSGAPSQAKKYYNRAITLSTAAPTRTGYTFMGWGTSSSATSASYQPGASYANNADATLYAIWKANDYAVTLDNQGATTPGTAGVTATYDKAMPSITRPTKLGYTFQGYYDATSGGTQYYTAAGASARAWNKAANTTLYARWTQDVYTITFKDDTGTVIDTQNLTYGIMPTVPSIPAKASDANSHYQGAWDVTPVAATGNATYQYYYDSLPHTFGTPTYTWSANNATVTAKRVCSSCDYAHTETVNTTANVTQQVGCVVDELTTYTASFTSSAFATQTKSGVITQVKPGHTVVTDNAVQPTCTATGLTEGSHCSACGTVLVAQTTVNALGHATVVDAAVQPTCTDTGLTEGSHCSRCNETLVAQNTVNALGHNYTKQITEPAYLKTAATCLDKAVYCYACVRCDERGTNTFEYGNALGHSFTNYISNNNATCTANATETAKCDRCDVTDTREIADTVLGHTFSREVISNEYLKTPATCLDKAVYYYACERCDAKNTETFEYGEPNGHSFTNYLSNNNATCAADGTKTAICDNCTETDTVTDVDSHLSVAHTPGEEKIEAPVAPTCLEVGNHDVAVYCTVCNAELSRDNVVDDALGHSFTNYISNDNATCTDNETETAKCDRCDVTDTREIANTVLGHDFTKEIHDTEYLKDAASCLGKEVYYYACTRCNLKGENSYELDGTALGHDFVTYESDGNATCKTDGTKTAKCERCDVTDTQPDVDSHLSVAHTPGEEKIEAPVAPTCLEVGNHDVAVYCTVCEALLSRVNVVDAALGHSFTNYIYNDDATCTEDGTKTAKCDRCEATDTRATNDSALGHKFTQPILTDEYLKSAATCLDKAVYYYACSLCGETDEGHIYEHGQALGHSFINYIYNDDATCTEDGTKTAKCDRCDATDTQTAVGSVLGHAYTKQIIAPAYLEAAATCLDKAVYHYACVRCDLKGTDTFEHGDALGHSFTNYIDNDDETCLTNATETAKCDRCDETHTREIAESALGHAYTKEITTDEYLKSAATCLDKAVYYYACVRCDDKGENTFEYGDALGHSFTNYIDNDDETCLTNATETAQCDRCDETHTREIAESALGHTYTKEIITDEYLKSAATCLDKAVYYYACVRCDLKGTDTFEYGDALGHSFTNYIYNNDETCTEDGTETAQCDRCDETHTRTAVDSAPGHNFTKQILSDDYRKSAATCTESAVYYYACARCDIKGENTFEYGEPLGHTVVIDIAYEPTCTRNGATEGSHCSVCGEILVAQIVIDSIPHQIISMPGFAPTCAKAGLTEGEKCDVCKNVFVPQYVIERLSHTAAATEISDVVPSTCTVKGSQHETIYCADCGFKMSEKTVKLPYAPHTEVEVPEVAATCTERGHAAGVKCSVCDKVISGMQIIKKAPHNLVEISAYAPTCTEYGATKGMMCTVCGTTVAPQNPIAPLGHDYGSWTVITEPTENSNGLRERTCRTCGYVEQEELTSDNYEEHHGVTFITKFIRFIKEMFAKIKAIFN